MPNDGYINLWRKSLDSSVWDNHNIWRFWTYCLMKASYKEHTQMVGYQEVTLQPGEFVFGLNKASEETGLSMQNLRTCLQKLEKMGNLTRKVTSKFSIISIVNWDDYQGEVTSKVTSSQQATNKQLTTNNKDNKGNKENNNISIPDFIEKEIWKDYLDMRVRIKKPATLKAQELAIKELEKLQAAGNDPNEVLKQSIMNSWQGVFPLRDKGRVNGTNRQNTTPRGLVERTQYTRPEDI